ncbi:hypothetical protein RS130_10250 [Paraglaciecola aquimarina]|uniref:Phosphoglyceromutase n=1 Tax=Paraglaciecola aquimarina TaxID=1235557 RepID=A0ABU3SW64_9ALTE|nr:hypothetical protein [Paraglaciecola aquimarina]MDU0354262.1 hypothetical protein [Paraglaciecola aquimarina]
MKKITLLMTLLISLQSIAAENLVIVSIDGLRWQEVFRGYQDDVLNLPAFAKQKAALKQQFDGKNSKLKRAKLMPFLWNDVVNKGLLIGNRDLNSRMNVTNNMWFSYP